MQGPEKELQRLRNDGLGAFPPAALPHLVEGCTAADERMDTASPFVAASAIDELASWWTDLDEEPGEGVPTAFVDQLDTAIRPPPASLLSSSDPSRWLAPAQALRTAVRSVLSTATI
jgi:hypothetical protein